MKTLIWVTLVVITFTLPVYGQEKSESDNLDQMIGQMIMIGLSQFDDPVVQQKTLQSIADGKVSGVILFEKDLQRSNTKTELSRLVWKLQQPASIPLFLGIDEEGGKVNRLKPKYGFPKTKTAEYLGQLEGTDSTLYYGRQTAKTLSQYGFNVNYAPVVDVDINPANPVIGGVDRSYSADYKEVVKHAKAVVDAHRSYQVATVLKHFPGHGSSATDTHLGIADVSDTWDIEELFPYSEMLQSGHVDAIMSSHIVNRTLDPEKLPGTLSKKMIDGLLRNFLGFDGVVFSDDMHMGAISKHYGFEEAIILAINAGVDVLMFSNNIFDDELTSALDLHGVIRAAVDSGKVERSQIEASYQRIMKLKAKLGLLEKDYDKKLKMKLELNE